ncbi:MAG: DUF3656 domain-containing protein [Oscillospiraceae bacterium]|nr:DUF3656 domain-containing protein [Oscillospiraceae bacterium]
MGLPEILAPAGGMESVYAAVRCGADGVYIGGSEFSARAGAENFSEDMLYEAARYCHLHGVKIYRAMNTMIFDRERESFREQVIITAKAGFDGLIIQDLGGLAIAKKAVPNMPFHASTQMTIHTPLGAKEAAKIGFCRVVPARELTLGGIAEICRAMEDVGGETEVFVHGAHCMCLSGQCYMSSAIGGRSANRGRCAQSCRLPISAVGGVGGAAECSGKNGGERYDLSLKDMSLVEHSEELAAAGVDSFKIEGRMKRPEYVAAAVTALLHALYGGENRDSRGVRNDKGVWDDKSVRNDKHDMRRLEAVFSRSGFTDGYLTGKIGREMFGSRTKENVTAAGDVLGELAALYKDEVKDAELDFALTVHEGTAVRLDFHCKNDRGGEVSSGDVSPIVSGDIPEKAQRREFTEADGVKNLSKLGGTRYRLGKISCDISPGLAISAACVNDLRRRASEAADRLTVSGNTPVYEINEDISADVYRDSACPPKDSEEIKFRIITHSAEIACAMAERDETQFAILPVTECEKDEAAAFAGKITVSLPDIVTDENALIKRLNGLCEKGYTHFFCKNFTHLGALKALGDVHIHGGWGMNIANGDSLEMLREMGFEDACLSFEMKAGQVRFAAKNSPVPVGIYAYGRLPLMVVRNCPVKATVGCKGCKNGGGGNVATLTDRDGRIFPVHCGGEYVRILNCDILQVCDKLEDFGGVSFGLLDFTGMDISEALKAFDGCISREKPCGKFTRGLYYRGII